MPVQEAPRTALKCREQYGARRGSDRTTRPGSLLVAADTARVSPRPPCEQATSRMLNAPTSFRDP